MVRTIQIAKADLEDPNDIQANINELIRQGSELTNDHMIIHSVSHCNCIEYEFKIKIINKLIDMLRIEKRQAEEFNQAMINLRQNNNNNLV